MGKFQAERLRRDDRERAVGWVDEFREDQELRRVTRHLYALESLAGEQSDQLHFRQGQRDVRLRRGPRRQRLDECTVGQRRPVVRFGFGEVPLRDEGLVPGSRAVDAEGDGVEDLLDRQGAQHVRAEFGNGRRNDAAAQFECAGEVEVAPRRVLRAEPELLVGAGE